jgi:hypothetical protein
MGLVAHRNANRVRPTRGASGKLPFRQCRLWQPEWSDRTRCRFENASRKEASTSSPTRFIASTLRHHFFPNGKQAYAARKMGNLTARIAAGRQVPGFWCMPLNHHQSIIRRTRRSLTLSKLTRPNPHTRSWPPKVESGPLPRSLPRGGTGKPLRQHVRRPCAHCPDHVRSGHSL